MSHGDDDGILCTYDGTTSVDSIIKPFRDSRVLVGKPKIFIIQACRGPAKDYGKSSTTVTDSCFGERKDKVVPTGSDELVIYGSLKGHVAYRSEIDGTWLVQNLLKVINGNETRNLELMGMVKKVIDSVSTIKSGHDKGMALVNYSGSLHKDLYLNGDEPKADKKSELELKFYPVQDDGKLTTTSVSTVARLHGMRKSAPVLTERSAN